MTLCKVSFHSTYICIVIKMIHSLSLSFCSCLPLSLASPPCGSAVPLRGSGSYFCVSAKSFKIVKLGPHKETFANRMFQPKTTRLVVRRPRAWIGYSYSVLHEWKAERGDRQLSEEVIHSGHRPGLSPWWVLPTLYGTSWKAVPSGWPSTHS